MSLRFLGKLIRAFLSLFEKMVMSLMILENLPIPIGIVDKGSQAF